jgi:hypothetical protein
MSTPTCFARSKVLLFWDPLRDDPRFEEIVQSQAPKETKQ